MSRFKLLWSASGAKISRATALALVCLLAGFTLQAHADCGTADQISPSPNPVGNRIINTSSTGCNGFTLFDNFGSLGNSGVLRNYPGAWLSNNPGADLSNTGSLFNDGVLRNDGRFVNFGGSLVNSGSLLSSNTLNNDGGGRLNNIHGGRLENIHGGTLNNGSGSTLSNDGLSTLINSGGTLNNNFGGTLNNDFGGNVNNDTGSTLNNFGTLTNLGLLTSFGMLNNSFGATLNNHFGGQLNIYAGVLNNNVGSTLNNGGQINNSGQFLNSGAVTGTGTLIQTAGITTVDGSMTQAAVIVNGGVLRGVGSITAAVTIDGGTIAPGDSVGTLTIDGNLTFKSGTLLTEIGSSGFDLLDITGAASLGAGTLEFSFLDGVQPHVGDQWLFLTANGGVTGWENLATAFLGTDHLGFSVTAADGGLTLTVTDVAAVPEPEPCAMLLAGLGLLGFVARLKKQKEAA